MNSKESILTSCVEYFKKRKEYQKVFQMMRVKWKSYGKIAGNMEIKEPSEAEREVLGGFLGKDFYTGSIRFSMRQFEHALKETRFSDVSLKEVLEAYFGEELSTNKEEEEHKRQEKERFLLSLTQTAKERWGPNSDAYIWLANAVHQKKFGYYLILREYETSPERTVQQVEKVCEALEWLKEHKPVRMAVLGAEITRNPHAFDKNTVAGKLLIQALCCINGGIECNNAEEILMLYYNAGIQPDDISSFTAAYGVHLYLENREHPAYKEFIELGESYVITLSNLGSIKGADAENKIVYVIENQMVFSHLCEKLRGREIAMVCTSGRIKTASWMLLDLLSRSGCRFDYSGDFDPEGLSIAEKVLTRYPNLARVWCMDVEDYYLAISDEEFGEKRVHELENISLTCFERVKREMLKTKRAGYQERLIEKMLRDILEGNENLSYYYH